MADDLHDEIDELAMEIEKRIQHQRETLEESYTPDSKYRRMEEADPTELFS